MWFWKAKDQYSRDLKAFLRYQPQLQRDHPGKVALMHGNDLVGIFDEGETAHAEGRKRFGDGHFMVWGILNQQVDLVDLPDWMKAEGGLAEELATFEKLRVDLERTYPGQFALVRGDRLVGVFPEPYMAEEVGERLFGLEKHLVKQIAAPNMDKLNSSRDTVRGHVA